MWIEILASLLRERESRFSCPIWAIQHVWIEILASLLRKRESRFSCPLWEGANRRESVNQDSHIPLSRMCELRFSLHYSESVNLDSRVPFEKVRIDEKAWIEIVMSHYSEWRPVFLLRKHESRFPCQRLPVLEPKVLEESASSSSRKFCYTHIWWVYIKDMSLPSIDIQFKLQQPVLHITSLVLSPYLYFSGVLNSDEQRC